MDEEHLPPDAVERRDAIDVDDFIYAATGARVRRLVLPDGTPWFPAADVCRSLGYPTTRKALLDHVPERHREILETVTARHGLAVPAGREWRRDLRMVNLPGLFMLVNSCTKPSCAPFKEWVAEIVVSVQRDGYSCLDEAEVQPPEPDVRISYAMPPELAEVIVGLEERALTDNDPVLGALTGGDLPRPEVTQVVAAEPLMSDRYTADALRAMVSAQQESARSMARVADAMERLADRLGGGPPAGETTAPARPRSEEAPPSAGLRQPVAPASSDAPLLPSQRPREDVDVPTPADRTGPVAADDGERPEPAETVTSEATPRARRLMARWQSRLTVTDDIWVVARVLAGELTERGEVRTSTAALARLCHLSERQVADSLEFLLHRNAIRHAGTTPDGSDVYVQVG
ncbi:BRO family protein [Streptomyces otsuchiensis]|uniref:BRO family protein n=1 Tax=Streptomyces otsuchiensis TaxID=2681388 RepID=UPI001031663C|nr:BRO family protein [Streptomyces otsuchiensis]